MSLIKDGFMNVQEAAEYVGCSVNFIRIRARDGRVKCYRMGKLYRFKQEDLNNLIEVQETPQNGPNNDLE